MATVYGTYQTDLGRDAWGVSLTSRFRLGATVLEIPDEADLLPPVYLGEMADTEGPCRMPVTPRRALLFVSDAVQYELPIPFRGGTAEYLQMLAEIEGNPLVRSFEILPEQIDSYECLKELGLLS